MAYTQRACPLHARGIEVKVSGCKFRLFLYGSMIFFRLLKFSLVSCVFFSPIPYTYTSLRLDGMARNIIICMDTQDHTIYRVWIRFIPTYLLIPRERNKTFGMSWN